MFPRLVMTVSVNRDTNTESDDYDPNLDDTACSLWLQKSITAATAFGVILKTPVHHNRRTHEGCLPASSASCDAERRRPLVRRLESFKHFAAHPSARLLSTPCTVGDWTTCIRPRDLIVSFVPNTVGSGMTITELFMLTGRYRSAGCIEQGESDDAKHPDGSIMTPCRQREVYIRWHLRLRMPWTEVGLFLLQVRSVRCLLPSDTDISSPETSTSSWPKCIPSYCTTASPSTSTSWFTQNKCPPPCKSSQQSSTNSPIKSISGPTGNHRIRHSYSSGLPLASSSRMISVSLCRERSVLGLLCC